MADCYARYEEYADVYAAQRYEACMYELSYGYAKYGCGWEWVDYIACISELSCDQMPGQGGDGTCAPESAALNACV